MIVFSFVLYNCNLTHLDGLYQQLICALFCKRKMTYIEAIQVLGISPIHDQESIWSEYVSEWAWLCGDHNDNLWGDLCRFLWVGFGWLLGWWIRLPIVSYQVLFAQMKFILAMMWLAPAWWILLRNGKNYVEFAIHVLVKYSCSVGTFRSTRYWCTTTTDQG